MMYLQLCDFFPSMYLPLCDFFPQMYLPLYHMFPQMYLPLYYMFPPPQGLHALPVPNGKNHARRYRVGLRAGQRKNQARTPPLPSFLLILSVLLVYKKKKASCKPLTLRIKAICLFFAFLFFPFLSHCLIVCLLPSSAFAFAFLFVYFIFEKETQKGWECRGSCLVFPLPSPRLK